MSCLVLAGTLPAEGMIRSGGRRNYPAPRESLLPREFGTVDSDDRGPDVRRWKVQIILTLEVGDPWKLPQADFQ